MKGGAERLAKKETDVTALARLKEDLRTKEPGCLYVFWGEEAYLREYYIAQLRACIAQPDGSNFELFEPHTLTPEAFADAALSYPMLSPRKFILVKDFDPFSPDAKMKPVIEEVLCDLPDFDCIVFDLGADGPSGRKNKKIEEAVRDRGLAVEFLRPSESELSRWIVRRFAALGKDCQPAEAALLSRMCGGLMYAALPEIEKVAAFSARPAITAGDINAVVTPVIDVVIYRITDAIASRQREQAQSLLASLLAQGTKPMTLIMTVGRAMRQLYSARLYHDRGLPLTDFMAAWHLKSRYVADMLSRQALRFRTESLRKSVSACFDTEMRLLNSEPEPRVELEMLITELCG